VIRDRDKRRLLFSLYKPYSLLIVLFMGLSFLAAILDSFSVGALVPLMKELLGTDSDAGHTSVFQFVFNLYHSIPEEHRLIVTMIFAAGLVIDGTGFAKFFGSNEPSIEHLILPISKFFVPIFFVHMGMQVDLTTFMDPSVIALGLALTAVAILGKQACGLGIYGKGNQAINRIMIGIGMVPRGEVGLIFAVIGASLTINNEPVVDTALYSAIVLMVMLTTMITPPGIKWTMKRHEAGS